MRDPFSRTLIPQCKFLDKGQRSMREPMYIPFANQPHKKYQPGDRRSRNDLRDQCNEHHDLVLHIYLYSYHRMQSHTADSKDTARL